ncbi:carbamoyl-phosphate synthase small chain [Candidatus Photodesmus katoptron]|uniref:Carbamoyl phosphate synthase small chain n=1 Tax=Candidatus Photodesmus katoptron Akat1 TaxID=1236703 RepID=S3DGX0_9GAMM|nr:carbamoyl-phosphate synthase small chain [Candidatus Photodesmus katoptron Akat1]KEY90566.1 carbamoyl-phosphate synthase small chain [Candidatus Photodesmus katoptron]
MFLEDGTEFSGVSIGVSGISIGEMVFNTSMTGYQEILTDPSYYQQIITFTYPHIGNTGVNQEDEESSSIHAQGIVIRELPIAHSNFRSEQSILDYIKFKKIVGIASIDTRKLTRIIREKGAQNACIIAGNKKFDRTKVLSKVRKFPGLKGMKIIKSVSTNKIYKWRQGSCACLTKYSKYKDNTELPYHVVVYDLGVKRNILRMLVDRGCHLTVVPETILVDEILALKPDGIFLSNGPGDPEACNNVIEATKIFLEKSIPIFGICLGHQILALASGAKTIKMKFGHHGVNHPVEDIKRGLVMITSQNHGFSVDPYTLPKNLIPTHKSLFDGSLQGIHRTDKPAFSFQGHPEGSAGPHDASILFDYFVDLIRQYM